MPESDEETIREWVLRTARERTEPVVDGKQMIAAAVWTSRRQLRSDSAKPSCPFSKDEIEDAVRQLREAGELFEWHGLITPADDERLHTIIENEQEAAFTRRILVGQVNEQLQEGPADA